MSFDFRSSMIYVVALPPAVILWVSKGDLLTLPQGLSYKLIFVLYIFMVASFLAGSLWGVAQTSLFLGVKRCRQEASLDALNKKDVLEWACTPKWSRQRMLDLNTSGGIKREKILKRSAEKQAFDEENPQRDKNLRRGAYAGGIGAIVATAFLALGLRGDYRLYLFGAIFVFAYLFWSEWRFFERILGQEYVQLKAKGTVLMIVVIFLGIVNYL